MMSPARYILAFVLFASLLLAGCAAQPARVSEVVTSLPVSTAPPLTTPLALGREPISAANAAAVAPVAKLGKGQLTGIALSPDGRRLAVASTTGVRLVDPMTLEETAILPIDGADSLAFGEGGAKLLTARGRRLAAWNVETGALAGESESAATIVGLASSDTGPRIAAGLAPRLSNRPEGFVQLSRAADAAFLRSLPDNGAVIRDLAQSRDGASLIVGAGREAHLWDLTGGKAGPALRGHDDIVTGVAFAGSARVVTASADGKVRIWQRADGKLLHELDTLDTTLTCVAATADGSLIAAGSSGGGIHVWNGDGAPVRAFLARPGALRRLVFTPDGAGLLTAGDDQTIARWRTSDWVQVTRKGGYLAGVYDVAFSPDGRSLVTGSIRYGLINIWRVADGALLDQEEAHDGRGVTALAYAPNGVFFASGGEDNLARLWSAAGEQQAALAGHREYVTSVAVSPDSRTIASGSYDSAIRLWSARDGKLIRTLEGHTSWVNAVAFSPDGARLLSASYDRTARIWSMASGNQLVKIDGFSTDVTSVAYAPNGKTMAIGLSAGGEVELLDPSGGLLLRLPGSGSEQVTGLSFSPDGRLLAVSYYQGAPARLWRVADGKLLATLDGARDLFSIRFSPDGKLLAGASGQGEVTLWGVR